MSALASALRAVARDRHCGEIGLEFALEELQIVQLRTDSTGLHVQAHATIPYGVDLSELLGDPKRFRDLVRAGLALGKFKGRSAVACMPASYTQVMPVSFQRSSSQHDDEAIARLMEERIGNGIAEFVIDYMPVQTLYEGKERLALVAICREEAVINFLELLRQSGLSVSALEIGPIAIRRLVAALQRKGHPRNILVVTCGREKSYLSLVSGDRLLADDEVDFGEGPLLQSICSRLDMTPEVASDLVHAIDLDPRKTRDDPDDARNAAALIEIIKPQFTRLASDIQRSLVFAQSESRGAPTNQVYLLGSIARWPGAAELLASVTEAKVAAMPSPLQLFSSPDAPDPPDSAPELAVATGLALRTFVDG